MTTPGDLLCGIDIGSDTVRAVLARAPESSCEAKGTQLLEVLAVGSAESRNSVQYGEVGPPGRGHRRGAAGRQGSRAGGRGGSGLRLRLGGEPDPAEHQLGGDGFRPGTGSPHRRVRCLPGGNGGRAVTRNTVWRRARYELLHALPQEFWVDDLDSTDEPIGWTGQKVEAYVHLVSCPRVTPCSASRRR